MDQPKGLPPLMGFDDEQYIPEHKSRQARYSEPITVTAFYHCICNGKRVFIWSWPNSVHIIVRDWEHAQRGWAVHEIQAWFVDTFQHPNFKAAKHLHRPKIVEPLLLQTFIHHITSGGNYDTI